MPALSIRYRTSAFWQRWQSNLTPFTDWIGELKTPRVLKADLYAGIMVATMLIPQSMAYAQLAGLPVYRGLYAAFIPVIFAAIFGANRHLSTGPVAIVSLLAAGGLQSGQWFEPTNLIAFMLVLALMVGLLQLLMGMLRLGMFVHFVSYPVIIGFTNAVALIIVSSQLAMIFGVTTSAAEHYYDTVLKIVDLATEVPHGETLGISMIALIILWIPKSILPRFPQVLAAVVVTTLVSWLTDFNGRGGSIVGSIPLGLPAFEVPFIVWSDLGRLAPIAIAIALIGYVDTDQISKSLATRTRQPLDTNQELVGQGMANIAAGLFQGYPVAGSHTRSELNYASGGRTGFAKIVAGLITGITLLYLTPYMYYLPRATLSCIIVVFVLKMVRVRPLIEAFKVQVHDGMVMVFTFAVTLMLAPNVEIGVLFGVVLSVGLYLYRTMRPRVTILSRHTDGTLRDAELFRLEICPSISVIRFDGSLFFANTGYFEDKILERIAAKPDLKFVIIDGEGINEIDASGVEILLNLKQRLRASGIELVFARTKGQIINALRRAGMEEELGKDSIFRIRNQAIMHAWSKVENCPKEGCNGTCPLRAQLPDQEETTGLAANTVAAKT